MSLSTASTDAFGRADGSINGSTLDNANGGSATNTWTLHVGVADIASGQVNLTVSLGEASVTVDSTTSVDEQQVSLKFVSGNVSPVSRANGTAHTGYFFYGGDGLIYRWDGAGSYTSLGSASGVPTGGDISTIHSVGSTHSALINGVLQSGPGGTDGTYATGKPGVFSNAGSVFDNFKYEIASGGGGAKPHPPISTEVL